MRVSPVVGSQVRARHSSLDSLQPCYYLRIPRLRHRDNSNWISRYRIGMDSRIPPNSWKQWPY